MGACCPRRCVGCQRGWPYDAASRHIGPPRFPGIDERWECNRVKWLGLRGRAPCTDKSGEVLWINSAGVGQQWIDATAMLVAWVIAGGTVVSFGAGRPEAPQPAALALRPKTPQLHSAGRPEVPPSATPSAGSAVPASAYLQLRYG
jgi:hypothetical protein